MNTHLVPELGKMKLTQLTPSHIQNFYAQKIEEGLSPEYVRYIHTILNTSLNQAVKWQLISRNPVSLVQPPRLKNKEQQTWAIEEANRFLDAPICWQSILECAWVKFWGCAGPRHVQPRDPAYARKCG
jgi:site-specific recombinase XerC